MDYYKTFDQMLFIQNLLSLGMIGILLCSFFLSFKIALLALVPTYIAFVLTHLRKKDYVSLISLNLIEQEFEPATLNQNSFYQICEHLSRTFNFPSFVISIQTMDNYYRAALIFSCVAVIFIYPLNHMWQMFLGIFTVLGVIYLYTDSDHFFSRIK